MGLFSVLSDTKGEEGASSNSSSLMLPTVLQMYTDDQPIQLEEVSVLSKYSPLTFQAIQIGSQEIEEEVKNRHQTPDLGIWNCRASFTNAKMVDSLLKTVTTKQKIPVYIWTVDLSKPEQVEPSLTLLQNALTRHLIEHPPETKEEDPIEDKKPQTATTSLFQLQTTEFGKANEDNNRKETDGIEESFQSIMTTIMICVKLSPLPPQQEEGDDTFKTKQAQALVIYHLRKFAAALNCTLCFVEPPVEKKEEGTAPEAATDVPASTTTSLQPTVDYYTVSKWWKELALGEPIWEDNKKDTVTDALEGEDTADAAPTEEEAPTPETVEVALPLYGPGKHQEDLIESVVLRSANYPGHWDASKDSLWVALPSDLTTGQTNENLDTANEKDVGDNGWLSQLRDSMASAMPEATANPSPEKKASDDDKNNGKDAEVSDFFASLLKKP